MAGLNIQDELIEQLGKLANQYHMTPNDLLAQWLDNATRLEAVSIHALILENISDTVFITQNNGNFTYVCSSIHKVFGYSAQEVQLMRNCAALGFEGLFDFNTLRQAGEIQNIEWRITDKNGDEHYLLVNVKHISLAEGEVLYTCRDITPRKEIEQTLRESEERYRSLVELSPDAILVYGEGKLLYINQVGAQEFTNVSHPDEIIGRDLSDLLHPSVRERSVALTQQLESEGTYRRRDEMKFVRPDGQEIDIEVSSAPITFQGKLARQAVICDITTRKKIEAELIQQSNRSEAYAEISRLIAEARFDFTKILDAVVHKIAMLIGDMCEVALVSAEGQQLEPVAFYHPNPEAHEYIRELYATTQPQSSAILDSIRETTQSVLVPDLTKEEACALFPPRYHAFVNRFGVYSLLMVPLRVQGEVIGILGVTRDSSDRPYTPDDQVFLENLAGRVALAIQNARLFEEVRGDREQIRQLARRIVTAQEEERRRIAYELHDDAGQALTALKIILQMIEQDIPQAQVEFRQRISETVDLADKTVELVRLLAQDLRPPVLDAMDLDTILESFCHSFGERTHIQVDYSSQFSALLPDAVNLNLYRFLQEALTNVAKHAQASRVRVRLQSETDKVRLSV
ncbi:MAG: PAS domain S-box protein, partial [Anaerolineae bacterium]|nr:PAS domain S-box protein [Anaerolineae bacterium]